MLQFGGKNANKTSSESKRHFTVVMGGKEHGLYVSSTPSSAAKKAVTKFCAANKSKKVEFSIREITQGSKKKTYGPYVGHIEKLKEPIELNGHVIKYKPVVKLSGKMGAKKRGMIGGAPKEKQSRGVYDVSSNNNNNGNPEAVGAVYNYVNNLNNPAAFPVPSALEINNINNFYGNNAAVPAVNNRRLIGSPAAGTAAVLATCPEDGSIRYFKNYESEPAVNNKGFINYFYFVIKGPLRELENISNEEIIKLLKKLPAKTVIYRKKYLKKAETSFEYFELCEIIVKIAPNNFEQFFDFKNELIDKFKHFFKKKTRPSKNILIFLKTFINKTIHGDEEITQLIKKRASNELHKLNAIKISFFVFEDKRIIKLIQQTVGRIIRMQIFFNNEFERIIDEQTLSYIGRTPLYIENFKQICSNIHELLLFKIPHITWEKREFERRINDKLLSKYQQNEINQKRREISEIIHKYEAPFNPIFSIQRIGNIELNGA
jgi:hypothetical protein